VPEFEQRDEYLEHIVLLTTVDLAANVGFHPDADITKDMNETNQSSIPYYCAPPKVADKQANLSSLHSNKSSTPS
jgi:hypothetical protein